MVVTMASIRKHPKSPYWIACFRDAEGKRTNRSTKHTDARKAKGVALEFEKAARKGRLGEMTQAAATKVLNDIVEICTGETFKVASIAEHFAQYLKSRETLGMAATTIKRYEPILNGFLKHIGPRRSRASIGSVTAGEIENFRDAELAAGKGGSTADYAIKVLRAVLEAARRKGLMLANPALAVELTRSPAEEREVFTPEELRSLFELAPNDDWKGMILIGAHCGLRIHDAATLTWDRIDLAAAKLSHRAGKTQRKTNKDTVIAMHPQLADFLKSLPGEKKAGMPLFPGLAGMKSGSAGGLSNTFGALMEKAGVVTTLGEKKKGKGRQFKSKGFHALRHTMVTRLSAAEVTADVRRAMAGHGSDEIHKKYVHTDIADQRKAVAKISAI